MPTTAPTGIAPQALAAQTAPLAASSKGTLPSRGQRAEVIFAGGLLDVRANNSSLNGILRDIARATGMKITGGVAEQRVFGSYGPAEPATVLATLLDGTGSNMLLHESANAAPSELILTPRLGGPSPPSPASGGDEDNDAARFTPGNGAGPAFSPGSLSQGMLRRPGAVGNSLSGPASLGQPQNNVNGSPDNVSPNASTLPTTNSVPLDALPTPSTTPAVSGIVEAPNSVPPGTTTSGTNPAAFGQGSLPGQGSVLGQGGTDSLNPGSANATGTSGDPKTPEQVYQMLEQMRQRSLQQNPNPQ